MTVLASAIEATQCILSIRRAAIDPTSMQQLSVGLPGLLKLIFAFL